MRNLRSRLPPVNSLVAFEASARHLSFTRAADELTISREAVSRHIRILENHLGTKLFTRMHRAIALTRDGEAFRLAVQRALEDIAQSADSLRGGGGGRPKVVVSATIAIASFWLTPRLPSFREIRPDVELRMVVSDAPVGSITERFDLALRYGEGAWSGYSSTHLFDVASYPVCSPGYLRANASIKAPRDLAGHTLLNLDGMAHAMEDWTWWLTGHGLAPDAALTLLGFDNYSNVIQAALEGQGIALGFSGIVDQLVERGALVRPVEASLSRGCGVYALTPAGSTLKSPAKSFYDWVLAEAGVH